MRGRRSGIQESGLGLAVEGERVVEAHDHCVTARVGVAVGVLVEPRLTSRLDDAQKVVR